MTYKISSKGIVATQGDTVIIPLRFQRDITGAVVLLQVWNPKTNEEVIYQSTSEHIAPVQGETIIKLESAQTSLPQGLYHLCMRIVFENQDVFTFFPPNPNEVAHFHIVATEKQEVAHE